MNFKKAFLLLTGVFMFSVTAFTGNQSDDGSLQSFAGFVSRFKEADLPLQGRAVPGLTEQQFNPETIKKYLPHDSGLNSTLSIFLNARLPEKNGVFGLIYVTSDPLDDSLDLTLVTYTKEGKPLDELELRRTGEQTFSYEKDFVINPDLSIFITERYTLLDEGKMELKWSRYEIRDNGEIQKVSNYVTTINMAPVRFGSTTTRQLRIEGIDRLTYYYSMGKDILNYLALRANNDYVSLYYLTAEDRLQRDFPGIKDCYQFERYMKQNSSADSYNRIHIIDINEINKTKYKVEVLFKGLKEEYYFVRENKYWKCAQVVSEYR